MKQRYILVSGGGTGGHLFPALALAQEFERSHQLIPIFVGANGKIEMVKVPELGYTIYGLPIRGLQRKLTWSNLLLPFRICSSLYICRRILRRYSPVAVVGTGGYASMPLLWVAQRMGIPTYIQEQNSYPGITNKLLSRRAKTVYTAYPKLQRFFGNTPIQCLGNPVRFTRIPSYTPSKTLMILGGSLGAAAINKVVNDNLDRFCEQYPDWNVVWQTGKLYYDTYKNNSKEGRVEVFPFIENMEESYTQADLIISRAGAGTLSELAIVGRASLIIPSPNVAENHQYYNAAFFAQNKAVELIEEHRLETTFWDTLDQLASDPDKRKQLAINISQYAKAQATSDIARHIIEQI